MTLIAKIYSLKRKDLADIWFELSKSSKTLGAPGARHNFCHTMLRCVVIMLIGFGMFINTPQ